jgi:hypothetical protein
MALQMQLRTPSLRTVPSVNGFTSQELIDKAKPIMLQPAGAKEGEPWPISYDDGDGIVRWMSAGLVRRGDQIVVEDLT